MMDEAVVCKKCGLINEYKIEPRGNHRTAFCSGCGSYIKHIPYQEPTMYIGKYKGHKIADIEDLSFLTWAYDNMKLSTRQKKAVEFRIDELEGYKYI